jgi:hypothetical protein
MAAERSTDVIAAANPQAASGARPASAGWRRAVSWYLAIGLALWVVQALAIRYWGIKADSGGQVPFPGREWLGGLFHWDGGWYTGIAGDGYSFRPGTQANVAFFPAYPLAMRLLTAVVRNEVVAGIVVSALSGLGASVALWTWMGRVGLDQRKRQTALLVLLLYPYGFFLFGVVYSDALFMLVCLGAFLLAESRRWWLAGIVAVAATAGRPTGAAMTVGLLVLALEAGGTLTVPAGNGLMARWKVPVRVRWRELRLWQVGPAVLSLAGLAAYSGYLWNRWGDPFLFVTVQKWWGQPSGPATMLKEEYFHLVTHTEYSSLLSRPQQGLDLGTRTIQGAILIAALVAVPFVGRRFGWGYAAFTLVSVAIPLWGSKDFMGSGRYAMAAFPVFVLLGEWLSARVTLARTWLVASAVLSATMMAFYAHGAYLT